MRQLVELLSTKASAAATIGARPSGLNDGVDITLWRSGSLAGEGVGSAPADAAVFIDGSATSNVTAPAGGTEGVELWGKALGQWWLLGSLHDGDQINIAGNTQGYAEVLHDLGAFERLAVAGTVSSGTATAVFAPLSTWTSY